MDFGWQSWLPRGFCKNGRKWILQPDESIVMSFLVQNDWKLEGFLLQVLVVMIFTKKMCALPDANRKCVGIEKDHDSSGVLASKLVEVYVCQLLDDKFDLKDEAIDWIKAGVAEVKKVEG